jgi:NADH:ubiquinone oxidoreductase subunit 4 (subunit M)
MTTMMFNLKYFIPLLQDYNPSYWKYSSITDCQWHEHAILGPLAISVLYLGIRPQDFFQWIYY